MIFAVGASHASLVSVTSNSARRRLTPLHASKTPSVNAAAASTIPISQVQVQSQPTGFFASMAQLFNKGEESHEDEHAHAHVMFHSHIAEMLAAEPAKVKARAAAAAAVAAHDEDEVPHFHADHVHSHSMFHSHIADKMAVE